MTLSLTSKLQKRIEILEQISNRDELGGSASQWVEKYKANALIEPIHNISLKGQIYKDMQLSTNLLFIYTIRFRNDITNKMRIKYQDKLFNILRVINLYEKNTALQILAQEVVNEI
jgi:SPP1 family predicted phage head-tail adaptor